MSVSFAMQNLIKGDDNFSTSAHICIFLFYEIKRINSNIPVYYNKEIVSKRSRERERKRFPAYSIWVKYFWYNITEKNLSLFLLCASHTLF